MKTDDSVLVQRSMGAEAKKMKSHQKKPLLKE